MTTIRDVARLAEVSTMTVSRVVNARPQVSPATRERVLAAMVELDYHVDLTARQLRSGSSGTVALIVPRLDHVYFGQLGAQLADAVGKRGRHLVVEQSSASREGELAALSLARLHMYDGAILSVVGLGNTEVNRIRATLPVVLLGEKPVPRRFDHVMMSNVAGARLATGHLLDCGARRVMIVGGEFGPVSRGMRFARTTGWEEAHSARGLAVDPRLVLSSDPIKAQMARTAVSRAVTRDPSIDALFCVTDEAAIGAMAGLADAGRRVPEDIQVVGFDNLAIGAHIGPGLTTIDPGNDWIVENVVRLLEARMSSPPPTAAEHLVAPARLVERGSTKRAGVR
ncbi:LacI family DNA-binding transcriptional regulator [Ruania halotolerans]|uniref:LacI family DNA-binding transcriptional regulator n=1 Tax=Ruania halotolerans TaxID=2897773 RepID=UPI001E360E6A|nr:LacI family DNA-binding transcriptional regulator [Ruania halotolerans]UFU06545.1 LacI family transcriptional regulator [Ruania halotolerans]